jgi:ParB-like chromosome segregation protein Spo0J
MAKLTDLVMDVMHCYDDRLPKNEDLMRVPPEASFISDIIEHGQLQPILMCHNDTDGWFIGFGRRRLMAIRAAYEMVDDAGQHLHDGMVLVRIGEGLTKNDAAIFSLTENAQREANPISDYLAIRQLLFSKEVTSYEQIAQMLHMTKAYVKTADEKFARVPTWALEGVLNGTIALSTAIGIGKFQAPRQKEVKKIFKDKGKITGGDLVDIRRAMQADSTAQVTSLPGTAAQAPDGLRQYFNRDELLEIKGLLENGAYVPAKKILAALLAQKE